MCQLCLSQLNCSAFKANELCSDYKGLNYSIHRLWIMQLWRCDRVSAHRMRNLTQVLDTARAWRGTGVCYRIKLNHWRVCICVRAHEYPPVGGGMQRMLNRGNWEETWRRTCLPSGTCLRFIRRKRAGGFRSIHWLEWSGVECSEATTHARTHGRTTQSRPRFEWDDCHCAWEKIIMLPEQYILCRGHKRTTHAKKDCGHVSKDSICAILSSVTDAVT